MEIPILLPKIFDHPFTYENSQKIKLNTGDLVKVPFGSKKEIGIVWHTAERTGHRIFKSINNCRETIIRDARSHFMLHEFLKFQLHEQNSALSVLPGQFQFHCAP